MPLDVACQLQAVLLILLMQAFQDLLEDAIGRLEKMSHAMAQEAFAGHREAEAVLLHLFIVMKGIEEQFVTAELSDRLHLCDPGLDLLCGLAFIDAGPVVVQLLEYIGLNITAQLDQFHKDITAVITWHKVCPPTDAIHTVMSFILF